MIGNYDVTSHHGRMECVKHCKLYKDVTGCQINDAGDCYVHTKPVGMGSGRNALAVHGFCLIFAKCNGKGFL